MKTFFTGNAVVRVSDRINTHMHLCGAQKTHVMYELKCASLKVIVWCDVVQQGFQSSLFHRRHSVLRSILGHVGTVCSAQLQDSWLLATAVFQQDGAPPQWAGEVHDFLNATSGDNWYMAGEVQ
jgi:hypothetical protein